MKDKLKAFFTLKRTMVLLAFVIAFIIFCSMGCLSGSIQCNYSGSRIIYTFNNVVCGYSGLSKVYETSSFFGTEGVFDSNLSGCAFLVLSFIFVFLSGLVAALATLIKKQKLRKIIVLSCGCVIFVCAIFMFLAPVFVKSHMINDIRRISSFVPSNFEKVKVNGNVCAGIWALIASGLLICSIFGNDCTISDVKEHKWHKKMISIFAAVGRFIENLGEKKEKPVKAPAPKVDAEVVTSPQVDVEGEIKPTSDPEIEKVTMTPVEDSQENEEKAEEAEQTEEEPKQKKTRKTYPKE